MIRFLLKRLLLMIPTLWLISIISFAIIVLPPGDYLSWYLSELEQNIGRTPEIIEQIETLREVYGLDQSVFTQYFLWIGNVLRGDFGYSFSLSKPVKEIIWERTALTLAVTVSSLLFTWIVAFPIGFLSAVKQYSFSDYLFTFLGFLGLSVPSFMLALILMYIGFTTFGVSVGGLFSVRYITAPWSWAKFGDLLGHLWVPTIVVGTGGTAGLIRIMRNNLLDEMNKPYVLTARAKGLSEMRLLTKYPGRIVLNPFLSTVGFILPQLVSSAAIVSVVLDLPTSGKALLDALLRQDMYLAGAIVMLMAVLTVIGVLLSDILLALVDPRIRYESTKETV